ncbi:UNVERIFIED_CONTAM: hypothetical protein Sindi_2879500 [Sesamum indicum]
MEGSSRRNVQAREDTAEQESPMIQLTRDELQRMMEEAGRNAIVAYERRIATPIVKETTKRQLFMETDVERASERTCRREHEKARGPVTSEVGSSSRGRIKRREPIISRAMIDNVSKPIQQLDKQIDELKKRGEMQQNTDTSGRTWFLDARSLEVRWNEGPQEHVVAFELVMNLYGQPGLIMAKLFVTTSAGKAQEWFTSLPSGRIETYEQLVQKLSFHFASKRKQKRKAPLALALARDPPMDVEQLMAMAQKYIDEEDMNTMKD